MKSENMPRALGENLLTHIALVFDIALAVVLILTYPLVAYRPVHYVFLAGIVVSLFLIAYYFMRRLRK